MARSAVEQSREIHANLAVTLERQVKLLESGSSTQQIVDDLTTQKQRQRLKWQAAQDQLISLEARERQLQAALDLIHLQIRRCDHRCTDKRYGD